MTRESFKIYNEVFDMSTLKSLEKLRNTYFKELDYCISTGKEANVFRAKSETGYVVVKIFRTYTTNFERMDKYIRGDPRFAKVKHKRHQLVYQWCGKEYRNLIKSYNLGISVPKPYAYRKNIIVMELIGHKGNPSLLIKDTEIRESQKYYEKIIDYMVKMYEGGIVHGDLSEFNILDYDNNPVIIDMAQSVLLQHPMAKKLLKKDFHNINKYFKKLGCKTVSFKEAVKDF